MNAPRHLANTPRLSSGAPTRLTDVFVLGKDDQQLYTVELVGHDASSFQHATGKQSTARSLRKLRLHAKNTFESDA